MKNKIQSLLIIGIVAIMGRAKAQQSQPLPDYDKIIVTGNARVDLRQADRFSFFSEPEDAKNVEAYVEDRVLFIKGKKSEGEFTVKVYFRNITALEIDEKAFVRATDTLHTSQLLMKLGGASKTDLKIKTDQLKVAADGAVEVKLTGVASSVAVELSGTSFVKANDLRAMNVTVQASGASKAKVFASEKLNATTTGIANVQFSGEPKLRNISIDGLGTVVDANGGQEYNRQLSQDAVSEDDTTTVKIGKKRFIIIEGKEEKEARDKEKREPDPSKRRRMKGVWGGFELGVNGFVTPGFNFNMNPTHDYLNTNFGRSWFVGINLPEIDGHLIRNKLSITSGLGFKWTAMQLDAQQILRPDTNVLVAIPSANNLNDNKLHTFNFTIPVLLKYASIHPKGRRKGFHFAAGIILNYVATSHLRTVTNDGGYEKMTVYYADFNINPFSVDATARFGYNWLKLFANYSLTPYFDRNKAPDIRTFSAGFTLIGF